MAVIHSIKIHETPAVAEWYIFKHYTQVALIQIPNQYKCIMLKWNTQLQYVRVLSWHKLSVEQKSHKKKLYWTKLGWRWLNDHKTWDTQPHVLSSRYGYTASTCCWVLYPSPILLFHSVILPLLFQLLRIKVLSPVSNSCCIFVSLFRFLCIYAKLHS